MSQPGTVQRRPNRRGHATRENMLEAALRALATGDPGSVSANRIARDIGATWGAVKYQFGDVDGFWAAVLHRTAERRGDVPALTDSTAPLRERVAQIIDILYDGLTATDSKAIENLRMALPREKFELERLYPLTAAELSSWGQGWIASCQTAFAAIDVDPERIREVATFIPGAMRGIVSERQLGALYDLDLARRGLTNAIVAYLEGSR
ncbi:TetR/AcrR family transcriptional regulator [Mycolicibacterium komossense]|uniref:TetR/AcrR family transcriptional regulator n=1 Tax=Mycolicibacterium komossense TaxID=1779 RepID=A0ABT3CMW1_9MYCO|nr:TetR/AcrR family transcriptional regulator [Mycolicibacterium komossense]MCV7230795.1 TetR/AcrR family transcriptional regulator [Mycolicibacterium komossense]